MQTPGRKGLAVTDLAGHLRLWLTVGLGVGLDLATKYLAWHFLGGPPPPIGSGHEHTLIDGWLSLECSQNPGIVFGMNFVGRPRPGTAGRPHRYRGSDPGHRGPHLLRLRHLQGRAAVAPYLVRPGHGRRPREPLRPHRLRLRPRHDPLHRVDSRSAAGRSAGRTSSTWRMCTWWWAWWPWRARSSSCAAPRKTRRSRVAWSCPHKRGHIYSVSGMPAAAVPQACERPKMASLAKPHAYATAA